jgi:Arc/MetJ-type ribon-helix-helix transcriptional regulator
MNDLTLKLKAFIDADRKYGSTSDEVKEALRQLPKKYREVLEVLVALKVADDYYD